MFSEAVGLLKQVGFKPSPELDLQTDKNGKMVIHHAHVQSLLFISVIIRARLRPQILHGY